MLDENFIALKTPEEKAKDTLFYDIAIYLLYLNHSINFLMYFVSGSKFRQAALDMITRGKRASPANRNHLIKP